MYRESIIDIDGENISIKTESIGFKEYIEFLSRTDLGGQYPKEDFIERIQKLVENVKGMVLSKSSSLSIAQAKSFIGRREYRCLTAHERAQRRKREIVIQKFT